MKKDNKREKNSLKPDITSNYIKKEEARWSENEATEKKIIMQILFLD